MKTAFVSDSGSGKSVEELNTKGIFSVPLQIIDGDKGYEDIEELSIDEVWSMMRAGKMLKTSLPSLGKIEELFERLKNEGYEQIFAVPICSGLSGTLQAMSTSANRLGMAFDYIDCHVTAVVQEYLVTLAKKLYEKGKAWSDIKAVLEKVIDSTNTVLLPNDLNHLKRGGRLTPLAAALGGLLKIKPVLEINKRTQGKIDAIDKVRTMNKAMDKVIEKMKNENVDDSYDITIAHVDDEAGAKIYYDKIRKAFPNATLRIIKLVSTVGVHTGRGCQALQYFKPIEE